MKLPKPHYFPDGSAVRYWLDGDRVCGQVFRKNGKPDSPKFTMQPDAVERAIEQNGELVTEGYRPAKCQVKYEVE